ncbi:hypothetical protein Vdis_2387 [Vulcanisaeta distributa DSM 14429]|uniref:Uncharacterized protein n=1 Tax=Vulcanisaeta distributa (strain DSM 14429 / JCM 11212 / NBRC 100878 / IC-017) TaxID=572478 RepID=E1QR64_VULDI|nr:hypothetical protein Vdis_2387 [Vulcanisaeta distributa DSM 14429]
MVIIESIAEIAVSISDPYSWNRMFNTSSRDFTINYYQFDI